MTVDAPVQRIPPWLRFLVVGGVNTGIFSLVFWMAQPAFGAGTANVIAFVVATGTGYVLHSAVTFSSRSPRTLSRFVAFAAIQTSALVVSTVALVALATGQRTTDLVIAVGLQVGVALLRFLVLRVTVFAPPDPQ